jgi:uncharacterized protein
MFSHFWNGGSLEIDSRSIKIPKEIEPFTLLHISDMHFSKRDGLLFKELKNKLKDKLDEIDLITWGGDLLTEDDGFMFLEKCTQFFEGKPIISILGNHDVYNDPVNYHSVKTRRRILDRILCFNNVYEPDILREKVKSLGVKLLENESMEINIKGTNIFIHGVKQPSAYVPHIKPKGLDLSEEQFNIMLVHRPDMRSKMVEGFDLLLGGHTHGGQIVLPFLGPQVTNCKISPETASGHYRIENTQWIVNNGFSSSLNKRFRTSCPRQISIIKIEHGLPDDIEEIKYLD